MDKMTPSEALVNMALYDVVGGDVLRKVTRSAQREVREIYRDILTNRYKNADRGHAEAQTNDEMKRAVVLHNLDMAAGGRIFSITDPIVSARENRQGLNVRKTNDYNVPLEDKIGWSSVNSSIGGQWPSRRNLLRQHLAEQSSNHCESPQIRLRSGHDRALSWVGA